VQVVEEDRAPSGRRELGAHVLREREVDRNGRRRRATGPPPSISQ
jgi:hypothetical protein